MLQRNKKMIQTGDNILSELKQKTRLTTDREINPQLPE